jgi:hypothetical protein
MKSAMTLEEFKTNANEIKKRVGKRDDIVDIHNGTMIIHIENINKYLEKYCCKNAEDLSDTLYYHYGIFLKIVE